MRKSLMFFEKAKTTIQNSFLIGVVFVGSGLLSACSDDEAKGLNGKGELRVVLNTNPEVGILTRATDIDSNAPDREDFTIYISGPLNNDVLSYQDLEEPLFLTEGDYTIKAVAGQTSAEGFVGEDGYTTPWYQAEQLITIEANQATTVNLEATLRNAKVSVMYTPEFNSYFAEYDVNITLKSSNGTKYFIFDKDQEYTPLYLIPGQLELNVEISNSQGAIPHYEDAFTIHAQTFYELTFDIEIEEESGGAGLNITFLGPDEDNRGEVNLAD